MALTGTKPPADIAVDPSLVQTLLQDQHPDLAHLHPVIVAEGWDNAIFRLGDEFAVRLPRRAIAAALIEHEQRWLPELAARLPLPVPVPIRIGVPSARFAWPWSIVRWLPGQSLLHSPGPDPVAMTGALEEFFRALHHPAPEEAPRSTWRGVPLEERTASLHTHLDQLDRVIDRKAVLSFWDHALSTSRWPGPPLWLHGDLHPGNLLVTDGQLSGVIDFGDLTCGDPATDLSLLWMLSPAVRSSFSAWPEGDDPDALRMRARAWALALGLAYLAHAGDDDAEAALGRRAIDAALNES